MPPKKKKGGKKKKKKTASDGEMTVEEKYKKTLEEIDVLKDHLAARKDVARRSHSASQECKLRMVEAEEKLLEHSVDQKAVSADMTRQYKTMQTELGIRIDRLESHLMQTSSLLEQTQKELVSVKAEKQKMEKEKDERIKELEVKINSMGLAYESVLNDAMDNLVEKMDTARRSWEDKATLLLARDKQSLLDFGLHPLDL